MYLDDRSHGSDALRWSGALLVVLALHGTAAWVLLRTEIAPMSLPAAPEAVMLDLAPDLPPILPAAVEPPAPAALPPPPAPPPVPVPQPPPPEALPPEPPPPVVPPPEIPPPEIPPLELPPTPPVPAEAVLPVPPPPPPPPPRPQAKPRPVPRPVERKPTPPVTEAVERPSQPMAPAPVQAAPAQPSSRPPAPASAIPASWRSELLGRLQRAKRYPDLARSHGDQGIATVTFTMDRSGRVLSVALVRGSGAPLLDDEAVALVHRAEPLPRMPDDMPGNTITLTVPINFSLR